MDTKHNKNIGNLGEKIAAEYLENNNYRIIAKNFRHSKVSEIDLIAFDKTENELVFVEVKTVTNLNYGNPLEKITKNKQKNIIKAAKKFLLINQAKYENINCRFDVFSINLKSPKNKIEHLKYAFTE